MNDPCDRCGHPEARIVDESPDCDPVCLCTQCHIKYTDEIAEQYDRQVTVL